MATTQASQTCAILASLWLCYGLAAAYPGDMKRASDAVEIARVRELASSGDAKAIRERARLSRSEVARSVEVDPSTIGRWEEGLRSPQGDAAIRYGSVLRELTKLAP